MGISPLAAGIAVTPLFHTHTLGLWIPLVIYENDVVIGSGTLIRRSCGIQGRERVAFITECSAEVRHRLETGQQVCRDDPQQKFAHSGCNCGATCLRPGQLGAIEVICGAFRVYVVCICVVIVYTATIYAI